MKTNKINQSVVMMLAVTMVLAFCPAVFAANSMSTDNYSFTVIADVVAPVVQECIPQTGSMDVPRSTNIQVAINDALSGVDSSSINLKVNGKDIVRNGIAQTYLDGNGDAAQYAVDIIAKTAKEYVVVYDPAEYFNYKETVTVAVSAADVENNIMPEYSTSFKVQNLTYGQLKKFDTTTKKTLAAGIVMPSSVPGQDHSVIACSASGRNVYIAWEEYSTLGQWNIYCAKSINFGKTFDDIFQVNPVETGVEHRAPAIAIDGDDNAYVAWQQRSGTGDWDVYIAKLESAAIAFSAGYLIYNDGGTGDQTNPAIAVGAALTGDGDAQTPEPATLYVCWKQTNGANTMVNYTRTTAAYNDAWYVFVPAVIRVDDDRYPQVAAEPVIDVDTDQNIYIAWKAVNNDGTSSLYFDEANISLVDAGESFGADIVVSDSTCGTEKPDIAVSNDGNDVFLLWKKLAGTEANLQLSHYENTGDYTLSGTYQVNGEALASAALGGFDLSLNSNNDAFAVWSVLESGNRIINMAGASASDYAFTAYTPFITDGEQSEPALGIDASGCHYYVGWTDNSNGGDEVFFCRNTSIVTDAIISEKIENAVGGTVAVTTGNIAGTSIEVPADAIETPLTVTVAEVIAAPEPESAIVGVGNIVDFGPGGTLFSTSATIRLPYTDAGVSAANVTESSLGIYYYNLENLEWEKVPGSVVDGANNRVSVATNHFSMYMIAGTVSATVDDGSEAVSTPTAGSSSGGGGGGGGCFIATAAFGTPMAKEVRVLCKFRDEYLLTNYWGTRFVKLYYRNSPPIANYIAKHDELRAMVRVLLRPLIEFGKAVTSDK